MRAFIKFMHAINIWVSHIAGALLLLMVLAVALQIVVRSALPKFGLILSVPWSEELPRYLLLWFIFLGVGVAARAGDLIAVESFADVFKGRVRILIGCFALLVTAAFLLLMCWEGIRWTQFGQTETSPTMGIRMSWVYLSLPVGLLLATLSVIARIGDYVWQLSDERQDYATDLTTIREQSSQC
jgi:TRAP-type C4-dicarboxylate transport system permease small subunit